MFDLNYFNSEHCSSELIYLNSANTKQKTCMLGGEEKKNRPGNGREEAAATLEA
jgi:hypothetical protein